MTRRWLAGAALTMVFVVGATPRPIAQGEDRVAALVGLARLKRDAGDFEAARRHYEQARALGTLEPAVVTEYFWLIGEDDAATALGVGREILQRAPASADVRDRTITIAIALEREHEVIELAEAGRRAHPQAALWPRRLGESYLRQARPADAVNAFRDAVALADRDVTDQIGLAVALEAAERPIDAVAVWAEVPAAARAGRPDWATSRLRALAKGAPPDEAAPEIEAWLETHPNDRETRGLLVDLRARSGRPDLALRAIGPLTAGEAAEPWARRDIDLSLAAGDSARAIARLEAIVAGQRQISADHWRLAELLLSADRQERARVVIDTLGTPATGCSDPLFGLVERLREPAATDLLLALVPRQRCADSAVWSARAIERAVAAERHAEALATLQAWPADSGLRTSLGRLEGQLLLWTGRPADAVTVLGPIVQGQPDDAAARAALVDAYRATGQPGTAWAVAEPLLAPATPPRRLIALAELALDAGQADRVQPILERVPAASMPAAERDALLGRALVVQGRFADAHRLLDALAPEAMTPATRMALVASATAMRVDAARTLRVEGRPADALALLDGLSLSSEDALLRAELILEGRGPGAGAAALAELARAPQAGLHVWLAWAGAVTTPAERGRVLAEASRRFPDQPDVLRLLGRTQWLLGEAEAARATAAATLAIAPRDEDAWFVLVDATAATRPRADLEAVLDGLEPRTADSPMLVVRMAERVAGLAHGPDDPLLPRALAWLDAVASDKVPIASRELGRGRVLAASELWPLALVAIEAALEHEPTSVEAQRLRADVLSWSGRHLDALAAYAAYLALAPDDLGARRQQARVAGWAGHHDEARRHYAALQADAPELTAIAAELAAKDAYFAGRWRAAHDAYVRWLVLEPDSADARFDLAETLRALDRGQAADEQLRRLDEQPGHPLARAALDRASFNRTPSFVLADAHHRASGYGGLRLLNLHERTASLALVQGTSDRVRLTISGSTLQAVGDESRRSGSRTDAVVRGRVSDRVILEARAARWQLGAAGSTAGVARADWQPLDRWTLTAGVDRERLLENMATVDRGLSATGLFVTTERQAPESSLGLRLGWQALSDGNRRRRLSFSGTRTLGIPELRGIVWIEHLAYRHAAQDYFSPAGFGRADFGASYTHRLWTPRFRHDRQREIIATYVIGADSRGTRYQQPSVRMTFEVVRGVAVDVTAGTIRSAVYTDRTFSLRLRLGGTQAQ